MRKVIHQDPYSGEPVYLHRFTATAGGRRCVRVCTASAEHEYPLAMTDEECVAHWVAMRKGFHEEEINGRR